MTTAITHAHTKLQSKVIPVIASETKWDEAISPKALLHGIANVVPVLLQVCSYNFILDTIAYPPEQAFRKIEQPLENTTLSLVPKLIKLRVGHIFGTGP